MPDLPDRLRVVRPQDLLALELQVSNLRVTDDGLRLTRIDPAAPALLILLSWSKNPVYLLRLNLPHTSPTDPVESRFRRHA